MKKIDERAFGETFGLFRKGGKWLRRCEIR